MDPFDNPRMGERPSEDPGQPTEASAKQPSDSEPLIDQARREKIDQLKKAVADGTYNVSAEEVARKLIEHMLEPKE
jgi:anti-sigma28 factor (negative regulator of flagellin synthesis)